MAALGRKVSGRQLLPRQRGARSGRPEVGQGLFSVLHGSLSTRRATATQALHDYGQSRGRSGSGDSAERDDYSDAAAALHVDGFDAEQIWGQLEAHGGSVLRRVRKLVARAGLEPHLLKAAAASQLEGMCPYPPPPTPPLSYPLPISLLRWPLQQITAVPKIADSSAHWKGARTTWY